MITGNIRGRSMREYVAKYGDFLPARWGDEIPLWAGLVALAVVLIGILDVVSTNAGLLAGAVEANPLMALAQEVFGWWWFAPKLALQFVTVAILLMHPVRAVLSCVSAVIVFNTFVVLNNFAIAGVI